MFGKTNTFVKHTGNYFMPTNSEERPRVYLNKVHLKGFKSIEDVTIDFQKGLNILIGKNGAGKSNFLEFLNIILSISVNSKFTYKSSQVEFYSTDDHVFVYEIKREILNKIQKEDFIDRIIFSESFLIDRKVAFENITNKSAKFKFGDKQIIYTNIYSLFGRLGYQYLDPLYIKFNLPEDLGCIETIGTIKVTDESEGVWNWDFPDTLRFLEDIFFDFEFSYLDGETDKTLDHLTSTVIFESLKIGENIIDNLRTFTAIEDVRFNSNINIYFPQDNSVIIDNVKIEFKVNGNWMPWSQLSDGTRRLFYIITEVTHADGPIFIEEPELGVHPHQFNLLMSFLKEQSENKQIIISTHSPKALDHLSSDELNNILITYYDQERGTQLRHLTDKEQAKAKKYSKDVGFLSDYWMYSDLEE
ncbi:AAA family ATPase [Mucilaginibacter endophyticus]|uniref:AAA family ATPase n=1 Tax=Mucilaginibacter endophyticus TaxID=2675003 RepID=UPI000E0DE237|nr:ATP-binding protein [Mucilaginibacter endophyticus]